MSIRRRALTALAALLVGLGSSSVVSGQATTPTTISVTGGSAGATQTMPTGQTTFGLPVPLKPNAENILRVTATDQDGRTARSDEFPVLQISLTEIVRAQVTAERLTTQEVRQLVAEGVINVADPDNFNVSRFVVALVVGGQSVQVPVPVVRRKEEPMGVGENISIGCARPGQGLSTTDRAIAIPCGGGGGGSRVPDFQIIPFEVVVPGVPDAPTIPGVILIEGRIRTLKEFFKVNLLLMNLSPIFTLTDLTARLELPDGALSGVAPAGGGITLPDIAPQSENTGQFIIRGDRIGKHTVTAHFGGAITGAFLPEPVPFSGSASTDLDVLGPPKMDVRVSHPNYVFAGVPYDLEVEIINTDTVLDALYTSLEIDVGGDADLFDETTGEAQPGPSVRSVGDILRGERIIQTYKVIPRVTGPITSCVGAADANIQLSVAFTGRGGGPACAIGTLPAEQKDPEGRPTVTVVPSHNTQNVPIDPAIVAIFSDQMIEATITTGFPSASFNVLDASDRIVGGTLQFTELFGATAAIFRPAVPLAINTTYTIVVSPNTFSLDGLQLASGIVARFTTEGAALVPDTTPPVVSLALEAPFVANALSRGQAPVVVATATDAVGVVRVDLLLDGDLVDSKIPNSPVRFLLNTDGLEPGATHELRALAHDRAGNVGTTTLTIQIAADTTPPTVAIVAESVVASGQPLPFTVQATDDGRVARVDVYLGDSQTPFVSRLVPPFQFAAPTSGLSAGLHSLRAVAVDGAGNAAEALHLFTVTVDDVPPVIAVIAPVTNRFRVGVPVPFQVTVTDNVGVASIVYLLDGQQVATGANGFALNTSTFTPGTYVVSIVATDTSGNASQVSLPVEVFVPAPDTTPPAAVVEPLVSVSAPAAGLVTVTGLPGAAEALATVTITNLATQGLVAAPVDPAGSFGGMVEAAGGQMLRLVVVDDAGNQSPPVVKTVPVPVTLTAITVTPETVLLNRQQTSRQLVVTGFYSDGSSQPVTSGVTFQSSNQQIAAVTAGGLVLPGQNGDATITVSALSTLAGPSIGPDDEVTGTPVPPVVVPVTVNFTSVTGLVATPNPLVLAGPGQSQQIAVQAQFSDATTGPFNGSVRFATSNPAIAIVDNAGRVSSTGVGSTSIAVSSTGLPTVNVLVVVEAVQPTELVIEPTSLAFTAVGQSEALTVRVRFSNNLLGPPISPVTFQPTNPAVATVSATGVVTAVANGSSIISVQSGSLTAGVTVSVNIPTSLPPPEITSLGRPIAGETDMLVILGRNFGGLPAHNAVTIAGLPAQVMGAASDRLIVRVPRGATTGVVQVNTLGQLSNTVDLEVYPRRAQVVLGSLPFDDTGGTNALADLGSTTFHAYPGDRVVLAGDPNTVVGAQWAGLIGPSFTGTLVLTINGSEFQFNASASPIDLTHLMASGLSGPTPVVVSARIDRVGVQLSSRALAIIAGPDGTGAYVGERFLPGDTIGQQLVVRFRVNAPDGTLFAATAAPWYRVTDGGWNNGSAGGAIIGGAPTPNDGSFRTFAAQDGEVAVTYSDAGVLAPFGAALPTAWVSLNTATATGNRVGTTPVASIPILIGALHSGSVIPEQTALLADGVDRPISVAINSVRDSYGNAVTEDSRLAMTAGAWYRRSDGGFNNGSAGGVVSGGSPTPNAGGFRTYDLVDGEATGTYSASGIQLAGGTTANVTLAVEVANAAGSRVTTRPFAEGRVLLSAHGATTASVTALPASLTASSADNRSVITITGIADASGRPVPDGARVAVTAGPWYRLSDGGYSNGSFGGTIVGGDPVPNDSSFRSFEVTGGSVTFTYSNVGLVLGTGQTATTVVSVLPAAGDGRRIGIQPFADVRITQAGVTSATIVATPASTLADGTRRPVAVAVTNITDAVGNLVPDGTRIALTAGAWYRRSDGGWNNGSAGGLFIDGAAVPNDASFRAYTVVNGRVDATYSAENVTPLSATDIRSAVIAATVASSANNNRLTVQPFAEGTVAVSSVATGTATVSPTSLVADRQPRVATVTLENLVDAQGRPIDDGTKVAITAVPWYRLSDGGWNNGSAGGAMLGGEPTWNNGTFRTYTVQEGRVTATYSSEGLFVGPQSEAPAILSVLPANAIGSHIGSRPFLTATVTLAGVSSGSFVAPASAAPSSTVNVTLTNIRDSLGLLVPDGTLVAITAAQWYNLNNSWNNGSAGGTITGGEVTWNNGNFRTFAVTGGQISFGVTLPSSANVNTVLSAVSAQPSTATNTTQPFAAFTIRVENQP